MQLHQQWHGYKRGHQLLASTLTLAPRDQDLIDKLSDSSGSPRPGERFDPYLTIYPLPSGQFHVVARTWQDVAASRSGTVFTRSILVPGDDWRSMQFLRPLFLALEEREVTHKLAEVRLGEAHWPEVNDPNLPPLVEAMFLERAGSIAAFGFAQAEAISGRLLEAVWPNRRASMAVCTYALGPRSLPDRDFDLVFAPETSRSRFAKWEGRKISASSDPGRARHEWTTQILPRIFHDLEPSLEDLDELGVFEAGGREDSSSLRLALLWSDLRNKAAGSPTSLLGMLDILSSLGRRPWTVPYLADLVVQSLAAMRSAAPAAQWQSLQLLVRKLGDDIPMRVVRGIFNATRHLAATEPEMVIDWTSDETATPLPHLLRPAVGRGLADLGPVGLRPVLRSAGPKLLVSLMAESPEFAEAVATSLSDEPDVQLISDLAVVATDDVRAARRLASGVARRASSSELAPLLKAALANSSRERFTYLAENVLSASGRSRPAVLETLTEAAKSLRAQTSLRNLALTAPVQAEGDCLLLRLACEPNDAVWLVNALSRQPERLNALLLHLMEAWSEPDLREVLGNERSKEACFQAVLGGLPQAGAIFVRLLAIAAANDDGCVSLLRRAAPHLSERDRIAASVAILSQILSADPGQNSDLLEPLLGVVDPNKFVLAATSTDLSGAQVGRNIASIANSSAVDRFVPKTDTLTNRLADRRSGGYGRVGYDAWASMLRRARYSNPEALVRSADTALDYALARPNDPAGGVVAAAFPVVYARLKKNSLPEIPFNVITAVFLLPIVLFSEWDRAKAARHGIVDIFIRSKWDPVELLRAGVDAGIPRKILGYLVSKPGGPAYFQLIQQGVERYPAPIRSGLLEALSEFRSDDSRHWSTDT